MSEFRGLLKFICFECRARAPFLVGDRFVWKCHHNRCSVSESLDHRHLEYDHDSDPAFFA